MNIDESNGLKNNLEVQADILNKKMKHKAKQINKLKAYHQFRV
jgi:hypothetical protein